MQFRLVLIGALFLAAGLIAYTSIPNVQRTPLLTTQNVIIEELPIAANSSVTRFGYVAVMPGEENKLTVEMTVTGAPGESAKIGLMVFLRNSSLTCVTSSRDYLVNQDVANETLSVSVEQTGTYCFVFANEPNKQNVSDKTVSVFAFLERRSEQILVSRDGSSNFAGLGVSAFGLLIFVYGFARKTVIPWE